MAKVSGDVAMSEDPTGFGLLAMSQIGGSAADARLPAETADACALLSTWVKTYLMASHPQLGRSGAVCPFTSQAFRIDTIRIGICDATSLDGARVLAGMRRWVSCTAIHPCGSTRPIGWPLLSKPNLRTTRTDPIGASTPTARPSCTK